MTETYTNIKTSVCENAYKCFYAGAAVPVLGLDVLLFRVSNGILTPAIHMALAGVLTELWCKWQPDNWEKNKLLLQDGELMLKSGAYGLFGGVAGGMLQDALGVGPILGRPEL